MRVYNFLALIEEALDDHPTAANRETIITFIAPHSGFCGPGVRPKHLGYPAGTNLAEPPEARYGLNRLQIEHILTAFDVTLPPQDFA